MLAGTRPWVGGPERVDSNSLVAGAVLLLLLALYAAAARKLESVAITGPMLFVTAGFILGPEGFGFLAVEPSTAAVRITAEVTLCLLLFSDAATVDTGALGSETGGPGRLLLIALPLAIIIGTVAGWALLPGITIGIAALLASMLAATDLSLGMAMFKNPSVPARVRRVLNIESGLNDGVASPFVTLFIALSIAEITVGEQHWLLDSGIEITLGLAIGVVLGVAGGKLVSVAIERGWSSRQSAQYAIVALALLAYGVAEVSHGNPFIAAFVGGLAYRWAARKRAVETTEFTEQAGTLLTFVVWAVFGAFVGGLLIEAGLDWRPITYALASLFAVRMIAVFIAFIGDDINWRTKLFTGWFGPRGLASVVFLLLAVDSLKSSGVETQLLAVTAGWTIVLSVFLHGISAGPVALWYGNAAKDFPADSPELGHLQKVVAPRGTHTYTGRRDRWQRAEKDDTSERDTR